ncbi:alpha/beta hydrolase family protein [Brachybacterium sp. AOP42-C2-15]|uniref:alpha/beta hydrolase family protein n=1 Tax=Brachybacterium sp. AOP42-C2-15 TaxID=3457670 RepID=UPI004033C072
MTAPTAWDTRHDAPIIRWADLALFSPRPEKARYQIAPAPHHGETLPLEVLYQPGEGDTLIVVLHGAIDREKYTPPRFEWLGTLAGRTEHVLYVADPTLSLASDLQIGWYVGSGSEDVLDRVARLVARTRDAIGAKRVLLMGGSAGGYASLMVGARTPDSRVLAFNPQVTIADYHARFARRLREVAFADHADLEVARRAHPRRLSVLDAYPSTSTMPHRALIVQNVADEFHRVNHLGKLAAQLGMPVARALSEDGRMEFDLRTLSAGHDMPYRHILLRYLELVLERWDEERVIRDDDDISVDAPTDEGTISR